MKLTLTIGLLLFVFIHNIKFALGQAPTPPYLSSPVVNHIKTWEPSIRFSTPESVINANNVSNVKITIKYFDGLGRELQTIKSKFSPIGKDLVETFIYDEAGRQQYKYLPYTSAGVDGSFKVNPFVEQQSSLTTIFPSENNYYTKTNFEFSPLNRIQKVSLPGISWAGSNRGVTQEYLFNSATDNVQIWQVSSDETKLPKSIGTYSPNLLTKNVTLNENGLKLIEFKDNEGKLILRKAALIKNAVDGHDGWLCTYFGYDDAGNVRVVISPKAVELIKTNWTLTAEILNGLCYQYFYDELNRMIGKKFPGTDKQEMVYDSRDRLVYQRNGNLVGRWMVTFYDDLNRPVKTGIYTSNKTRAELQSLYNNLSGSTLSKYGDLIVSVRNPAISAYKASNSISLVPGFSSTSGDQFSATIDPTAVDGESYTYPDNTNPLPTEDNVEFLTYSYYDNYTFNGSIPFNSTDFSKLINNDGNYGESLSGASVKTIGLQTGKSIKILGSTQWLTTTDYYDDNGQVIQTISNNSIGGTNSKSIRYGFNSKIVSTYLRHSNNIDPATPQIRTLTVINHDVMGRLLNIKKKLNDESSFKTVVSYKYNELGYLQEKTYGSNLATDKFEYNPNGFIIGMNKDYVKTGTGGYFGYELIHDKPTSSTIPGTTFKTPQFDGSIAGIIWRGTGQPRKYDFSYDNSGRLLLADYALYNSGWTKLTEDYTVRMGDGIDGTTAYDANGNIRSMIQNGPVGAAPGPIDNLTYSYINNSNQLKYIYDNVNNPNSLLGDFREPTANKTSNTTSGEADYTYDKNGNITIDKNKGILSITYNHLNLPEIITFSGNSSIAFQYSADGTKLKKTVIDNTTSPLKTIVTNYDNGFEYQNSKLKVFGQEEGRVRLVQVSGLPTVYAFDYYIKDYLGNIRSVLTDNSNVSSTYIATMESDRSETENTLFSNINTSRAAVPVGFPTETAVSDNKFVVKLNGDENSRKIGPSLVLRVMKGDTVQISTKAFYKSGPTSRNDNKTGKSLINFIIASFQNGVGRGISHDISNLGQNGLNQQNLNTPLLQKLLDDEALKNPLRPKAYLNYLLFDDKFSFVDENSGVRQIKAEPDQLQYLTTDRVLITKSGFLYISESNETSTDVYFDNLSIVLAPGPLLEESHYYPFGLKIDALSSGAYPNPNYYESKIKFNGKELNSKELRDSRGLEWHDFGTRQYDAQIGRWNSLDPIGNEFPASSPYIYALNNPIKYIDPDGNAPTPPSTFIDEHGNVVGGSIHDGDKGVYMVNGLTREKFDVNQISSYKNGTKIGETYSIASFLSPSTNQWTGNIDVGSYFARHALSYAKLDLKTYMSNHQMSMTLLHYMRNAGNGQVYDIKSWGIEWAKATPSERENYVYQASFAAPGIIMTRRDVGNYFAGMASNMMGLSRNMMHSGFGAFQQSNNKMSAPFIFRTLGNFLFQSIGSLGNALVPSGAPDLPVSPKWADDRGSEDLQNAGFERPLIIP
ncbi:DUF6443 domain-containing protein [Chitinophaga sp. CC14]|uniref:DUF6443 domain-containing protein n=1 Tax=Chitinophaga sp. CC14 TaxID=3029199 RepID=UPI003B7E935C